MTSIAIIQPRDNRLQSLLASAVLASATLAIGVTTARLEYVLASLAASATILAFPLARRNAERASRLKRLLLLLPDLLREGVDATPGRLLVQEGYTGRRPLRRLYIKRELFSPRGEPITVTLDTLAGRNHALLILARGGEGVVAGEAYRVELEDYTLYILVPPTRVSVRLQRRRLQVRRGEEYAEAIITRVNGSLAIILNHVGVRTKAGLKLEARAYNVTLSAKLVESYRGSIHYTLFFAMRSPRVVVGVSPLSVQGVARVLGYGARELTAIGPGLEGRLVLELRRGPFVLDSDEARFETYGEGPEETPST